MHGIEPRNGPHLMVEDLLRVLPPVQSPRLCGLADAQGEDRALGVFRADAFARHHCIWAPIDTQSLHRLRLGKAIPPELLVQLIPRAVAEQLLSADPFRELNQPFVASIVDASPSTRTGEIIMSNREENRRENDALQSGEDNPAYGQDDRDFGTGGQTVTDTQGEGKSADRKTDRDPTVPE